MAGVLVRPGARVGPGAAGVIERVLAWFDPKAALLDEIDARRLFLWLPVAMGIGVLLAFLADGTPSPWPPLALMVVMLVLAWRQRAHLPLFVMAVAAAALFAGFASATFRMQVVAAPVLERATQAQITGFVETVDAGPAGGRLVLSLTSFSGQGIAVAPKRIRVTFRGSPPRAGDHVAGSTRLTPPPQPALPGGYDFARDAYFLQLGAVGRWHGVFRLSPAPAPASQKLQWWAAVDNARTDLTNRIQQKIGGQAGALSAALVTGKRGLIDEPTNDALRASGLYHIVSISGLHMVLAAGVFFWIAQAALAMVPGLAERRAIRKDAAIFAMAGATAYCVFSGSEVATERSLIMTLVMLGAVLFDRPVLSMRNVAIAALIVLIREPETLLGPSFQMSFAAVIGMIAAAELWSRHRPPPSERAETLAGRLLRRLVVVTLASLAMTLVASLATAPFAAYHFQRFNPYALIGNGLAIPFVSLVVMPAAVLGTLLLPFGLDGPVWQLMGAGSTKVLEVASQVARIHGSVTGIRAFDASALALLALGFLLLALIRARLRLMGLLPLGAGLFLAAHPPVFDGIVDRDGQMAAFRTADGRLALLGRSRSAFITERWLAADGDLRRNTAPELRAAQRCDAAGCVMVLPDGRAVALITRPEAFEEDCQRAAIVITGLTAPAFCSTSANVYDRTALTQTGSIAWSSQAADKNDGLPAVRHARPLDRWKPWFGRKPDASPKLPTLSTGGGDTLSLDRREEPPPEPDERLPLDPM